jgi:hypothetical protein
MAPPGIPNTVSTPAASSERIKLAAPVIGSACALIRAGGGLGYGRDPAWAGSCGRGGSDITVASSSFSSVGWA